MQKRDTLLNRLIDTYEKIEAEQREPRLYILVRNDLSRSQKLVQAVHAASDLIIMGKNKTWRNGIVICKKVKNEDELLRYEDKLVEMKIDYVTFDEEDMDYQITALSFISKEEKLFPELPLL